MDDYNQINELLIRAKVYAARGWPVFPLYWRQETGLCSCNKRDCPSPAKHPLTKNGFYDATTDQNQIEEWSNQYPHANIGIRTGQHSGLVAVDIDTRYGGEETIRELEKKYEPFPETLESIT